MKRIYYGSTTAVETPAAGVTGLLCRTADGSFFFRVKGIGDKFEDYLIRHDDMTITISASELVSFYKFPNGEGFLDHSSLVLGLKEAD